MQKCGDSEAVLGIVTKYRWYRLMFLFKARHIIIFCTSSFFVCSSSASKYYWAIRISPNMEFLIQALIRVSQGEGAGNQNKVYVYYLQSDSFQFVYSEQYVSFCIGGIMRIPRWRLSPATAEQVADQRRQKQKRFDERTVLDNHPIIYPIEYCIPQSGLCFSGGAASGLQMLPQSPTEGVNFAGSFDAYVRGESSMVSPSVLLGSGFLPVLSLPQWVGPNGGIQISTEGGHLIPESALATALNEAMQGGETANESDIDGSLINLLILLHGLTNDAVALFFNPDLQSYILTSNTTDSALQLIPHEALVRLGLLPGADAENMEHINPDTWMKDE